MINEEKLAEIYNKALGYEKAGEFDKAAHHYRQMLIEDVQDHAGAAVRLAAIGCGPTPKKASSAYITTLFDQHADVFDLILVDALHYDVPQQLYEFLQTAAPERIFNRLLDLGCGTGLVAQALEDIVHHKTGVDLAENMIAIAHEKEDYDALFVGDMIGFLEETKNKSWDLIVATDVLPYLGEVDHFFTLVGAHLEQNGIFAFSSESLDSKLFDGQPYKVGAFQRFAHQADYLEDCLRQSGLQAIGKCDIIVRQEQGQNVNGQLFLGQK